MFCSSNIVVSGCFLLSNPHKCYIWNFRYKRRVTYRFSYAMRHNNANKVISHPLPYASFPEFWSISRSIFILDNLIVGWVRSLLIKSLVFCIKSIDLESVKSSGSRIYQSKSWYYLGLCQTSKMEFFTEIVFGYKPLFPTLRFDWFHKTLSKTIFMFC